MCSTSTFWNPTNTGCQCLALACCSLFQDRAGWANVYFVLITASNKVRLIAINGRILADFLNIRLYNKSLSRGSRII